MLKRSNRSVLFIVVGTLTLSLVLSYWFFFWPPKEFPSKRVVIHEINRLYPDARAKVIQDTLFVDDGRVVVPYISKSHDYGISYWVWKNHKWQVVMIETKGEPKVWKVDGNDPSSYVIVWNVHPDDQLKSIQFYLIRNRNYGMTNGMDHYSPKVQMEKDISLVEKSYGMLKLPKDWAVVLDSVIKEENFGQSSNLFNHFFPLQSAYFGWIPYDQTKSEVFPERTVNGNAYSTGDIYQEHIMIMNKVDVETPKGDHKGAF